MYFPCESASAEPAFLCPFLGSPLSESMSATSSMTFSTPSWTTPSSSESSAAATSSITLSMSPHDGSLSLASPPPARLRPRLPQRGSWSPNGSEWVKKRSVHLCCSLFRFAVLLLLLLLLVMMQLVVMLQLLVMLLLLVLVLLPVLLLAMLLLVVPVLVLVLVLLWCGEGGTAEVSVRTTKETCRRRRRREDCSSVVVASAGAVAVFQRLDASWPPSARLSAPRNRGLFLVAPAEDCNCAVTIVVSSS